MTRDHEHVREELGAYVLGALEPTDRRDVESHVSTCTTCRDELARLSGMPALLDRLSPEEARSDLTEVPSALVPRVAASVASTAEQLRRSVRRWQVATAAAVVAAAVAIGALLVPGAQPPEPVVVELRPATADTVQVDGTARAYAWEWGTTVEIQVSGLPERSRYEIWVVDADGHREPVGTWGPTGDGAATVRSASAVQREHLASIEVRDADGQLLLGGDLDGS